MNPNQKVVKIISTVQGLMSSNTNVVIFKDEAWVWLQYYMSIFLERQMVIVVRLEDKKFIKRLENPLVKAILKVSKFDDATTVEVAKKIGELHQKGIL